METRGKAKREERKQSVMEVKGRVCFRRIERRAMPSVTKGLRKIRTWKHSLNLSRQTSFASLIKAASEAK